MKKQIKSSQNSYPGKKLKPCKITIEVNGYNDVFISCPGYNSEHYSVISNKGVGAALVDFLEGKDEVDQNRENGRGM
jgi:hypothetical protein